MGDLGAQPTGAPLQPHLTEFGYPPPPVAAGWLEQQQQQQRPQFANRTTTTTGFKYPFAAYPTTMPPGHYNAQYTQMWSQTEPGLEQPVPSSGISPFALQNAPAPMPVAPQPRSQALQPPHGGTQLQPDVVTDAPQETQKPKKPSAERKKRAHSEKTGITWQSTYKGPAPASVEPVDELSQYPPAPNSIPAAAAMPVMPLRRDSAPHPPPAPHLLIAQSPPPPPPPHVVVAAGSIPMHPGQEIPPHAIQYIRMPHGYAYPAYAPPPPPTQTRMTLESAWTQWQFIMSALDPDTMRRFATIVLRDLLARGILRM